MKGLVSVIMPTYNQASFIRRAIISLMRQSYTKWELIIVNDGSTDNTEIMIEDYLESPNVHYCRLDNNEGMCKAINVALDMAKGEYIAYLPSDDFYYVDHLDSLIKILDNDSSIIMAFSGLQFSTSDSLIRNDSVIMSEIAQKNNCIQLVQVAHRKTEDRWVERSEMISDDLFFCFWNCLLKKGNVVPTLKITAQWTDHPEQRHKNISENHLGGINRYRSFYKTRGPLKLRIAKGKLIDERELYSFLPVVNHNSFRMKVLFVGILSYNAERVCALEEAGCKLYGIWKPLPKINIETVGRFPFGDIVDIRYEEYNDAWIDTVKVIGPDIIYIIASSSSLDFVYDVMKRLWKSGVTIPFAFHFKESPLLNIKNGKFYKYLELYQKANVPIFINELTQEWFKQFSIITQPPLIMDQDLPKIQFFSDDYSRKISSIDGEVHTLISGRMIGIDKEELKYLANNGVHIHIYSDAFLIERESRYKAFKTIAPEYFHVHGRCPAKDWVKEYSKYDVGWLHSFVSGNEGEITRLSWDDLNVPNRISTYAAAGLPMILRNAYGHRNATYEILKEKRIGVLFDSIEDLVIALKNKEHIAELTDNIISHRMEFTFDYYVPMLIDHFKDAINNKHE